MADPRIATVTKHLERSIRTFESVVRENADAIVQASDMITAAVKKGCKLLICGNGGSAADAQHMATELMSRLHRDHRRPAIAALALTTDTSFLTAYANDEGFEGIFARQVEGLGKQGDVLLGITTSGSSANVLRACEEAKRRKMMVIGLTGAAGLQSVADCVISVHGEDTQCVQEAHLAIEHIICELVENDLHPAH
ncbi:SIS domain-containing protein [Candidatus Peregrinibacteria bacterium]|nr:SIS domain-containing protein [Candidatus Peregrinibacteria bacterium]